MKSPSSLLSLLAISTALVAGAIAQAAPSADTLSPMLQEKTYRVTITNLTDHQVLTPAVAVTHGPAFWLFEMGESASPGLAMVAEDGGTDLLVSEISASSHVKQIKTGPAIMPGESKSFEIRADHMHTKLSLAGMLASTNDGFYAIRGKDIFRYRKFTTYAHAYDAGSEKNSEDCAYVPGPPCGSHDVRDPENGVVMHHMNIQGTGGIPAEFDWNPKVAKIEVEKVQ